MALDGSVEAHPGDRFGIAFHPCFVTTIITVRCGNSDVDKRQYLVVWLSLL